MVKSTTPYFVKTVGYFFSFLHLKFKKFYKIKLSKTKFLISTNSLKSCTNNFKSFRLLFLGTHLEVRNPSKGGVWNQNQELEWGIGFARIGTDKIRNQPTYR